MGMESSEKPLFDNRYLSRLIIPLIVETLLSVTIGMMDTVMVSSVGEHAVSGVSLVDSISNLFVFLFTAFATGGAVVTSQYLGRKDSKNACFAAKTLIYLAFLSALSVSILMVAFKRPILSLVYGRIEDNVRNASLSYMVPIALSFPFLSMLNASNALFRSMGKSKITMKVSVIMNIINISGNAVFIYLLDFGSFGAGLASLISRFVACSFMLYKVTRKNEEVHVSGLFKFEFSSSMAKRIMRIALPSGIENSLFHIGKILVSSVVSTFGTASIAANAVAFSLGSFANIPGSAIGLAAVTIIGQCCGAGRYSDATLYGKKLLKITYSLMGITCTLLFLFCPTIVSFYHLSDISYEIAMKLSRNILIQTLIFWPLAFQTPHYLRAAGDAKFTMFISMLSMFVFRVGFGVFLAVTMRMGVIGIFWGMYTDWYFRGLCFVIRFKSGRWKEKKVI